MHGFQPQGAKHVCGVIHVMCLQCACVATLLKPHITRPMRYIQCMYVLGCSLAQRTQSQAGLVECSEPYYVCVVYVHHIVDSV